ncbi:unnamed protein product [Mytilus coruscus]|uniref:Neurotransmitter-gated ion-channel ligand-binding domain-containing protein n=1 Tax=Mytilus coruscus TaxID=42192 RepID=A0A6J8BNP5_MYTCO|nr:unnamed protein product [Mytilus coruscus]
MNETFVFLIIYFICVSTSYSQTLYERKALKKYLFTTQDYDVTIKPTLNQTVPIKVKMGLQLTTFIELNEAEGKLVTMGFIRMKWKDELLTWSPRDYGGIRQIDVPQNLIWKPEIFLTNSFKDFKSIESETISARITFKGDVIWIRYQMFETNCFIDLTNYPFDIQKCHFSFLVCNREDVQLEFDYEIDILANKFDGNGIWNMPSENTEITNPYETEIYIVIEFKREVWFFVVNLIVPLLSLALLNKFTFIVPVGSERIAFTTTAWLSYIVYLTLIATEVSARSDSVPTLSIYLTIQIATGTLIVILTLFQSRLAAYPKYLSFKRLRIWRNLFIFMKPDVTVKDINGLYKLKSEDFLYILDRYLFRIFLIGYAVESIVTFGWMFVERMLRATVDGINETLQFFFD